MSITFLANLWNFINAFGVSTVGGKIAMVCGTLLFNLLLAVVFLGIYKVTPKMPTMTVDNPELDNLVQEISKSLKGGNQENEKSNRND